MLDRIRQTFPFRWCRPAEDPLVKVASTIHRVEVEVWSVALQRQGVSATVRERGAARSASARGGSASGGGSGQASREGEAPLGWEVWVRASDEPKARLILGLSGHSVIRLPRRKTDKT